ncbi:MAG: alpha-galactosidase [Thermoguttaceae bacterium]|nr:alpha-galactosidase [Thermoguttaceae bacterium]
MKHLLLLNVIVPALTVLLTSIAVSGDPPVIPADPFAANAVDFNVWGPNCPKDSLMPDAAQIKAVRAWEQAVFAGQKESFDPAGFATHEVTRQDYSQLRFNESCMGTPLRIGHVDYTQGLGTHANSEIIVRFPKPVVRFTAQVGIDNNYSTCGERGSVVFAIRSGKKEIWRSEKKTGNQEPTLVNIAFEPTDTLTLLTETTNDGPAFDQCDWSVPVAQTSDGQNISVSKNHTPVLASGRYPFAFVYGGKSSDELLPTWKFALTHSDPLHTTYSWTDPKSGLVVEAQVRRFESFAGIDWVLVFKNMGKGDTPLLSEVKAVRADFSLGLERKPVVVHTLRGDYCDESSWLPQSFELNKDQEKSFAPTGGRSSNLAMPFWNLARHESTDREYNEGVFASIGWSGQWSATFKKTGHHQSTFTAGQEEISTVLHAGENIRSPRILLMPWYGERCDAHVLFRRLLMFEYAPKVASGPKAGMLPQPLEIFGQCFDRYYRSRESWKTFDSQVEFAKRLAQAGCTSYWFDAAWFPGGFPRGVGNWFADRNSFPKGLEPLGKTVHELGLKFLLWFEPERVAPNTDIANNHPEFVLGGKQGGLYNLADPAAEQYLTNLLSQRIKEFGVDIYRNDFNIDPLAYWKKNDEVNRRGMTEIRYIEAHYRMWDTLRKRHPGLWIDNCASGGRRIDLETISRSVSLWRSDTCCRPDHPEWDQIQSLSISQYIPIFASVAWDPSPYTFRSAACPGAILQYNFLDDDYDPDMTKRSIQEAKIYQKFWYGDIYPLSLPQLGKTSIIAWQCHRSDLNAGIVYVFRQSDSIYLGCNLNLKAIDTKAVYTVRFKSGYSIDSTKTMTGAELIAYPFLMPTKKSAIVMEYIRTSNQDAK